MTIRNIELIDPYLKDLSHYFRLFYEKEPWGDYKGCDFCFSSAALKEAPRFAKHETHCIYCKAPLGPFWSESRCKSALAETNLFTGLVLNDTLKGWIIAKPVSETIIAIDYMGLDPVFRRIKPKVILMKEMAHVLSLFYIKKHCSYLNEWASKHLLQIPIVSLQLFLFFEEQAKRMGYKSIQSTTHKNAKNIYYALRSVGFKLTQTDLSNDRVLFVKQL